MLLRRFLICIPWPSVFNTMYSEAIKPDPTLPSIALKSSLYLLTGHGVDILGNWWKFSQKRIGHFCWKRVNQFRSNKVPLSDIWTSMSNHFLYRLFLYREPIVDLPSIHMEIVVESTEYFFCILKQRQQRQKWGQKVQINFLGNGENTPCLLTSSPPILAAH